MKILCNVCEKEEATVLCCADDAALCSDCDGKVHAANKLSVKHERFLFSSDSSQLPKCDICQEKSAYFFCLEDRAVLCRECDAPIHRANAFVSAHQRFLLTGAKVSLKPVESIVPASFAKSKSSGKLCNIWHTEFTLTPKKRRQETLNDKPEDVLIAPVDYDNELPPGNVSFDKGSSVGNVPPWHLDEFLGYMGFNQNFGFAGVESSKGGDEMEECCGQEVEPSWNVPQNCSSYPPPQDETHFHSLFVPDIASLPAQPNPKRFRHFYVS